MSARCDVCGKEPSFGRAVARLGRNALKRRVKGRSPRMFKPNIQNFHTIVDGSPVRAKLCTKCIKRGKVLRRAK